VCGGSRKFFFRRGPPEMLAGGGSRNEALDGLAARRRNALGVGDKAITDALPIRDELPTDGEGVCHAGPLII